MENLIFAFNAIAPILLQITLGYILARIGFLKKEFLSNANKLVFTVGIPTLLFINVYSIESFKEINFSLVLYCIGFTLLLFAAGIVLVRFTIPDEKQKGVILQCVFRSNFAIIGLPLAEALGGPAAKGAVAVLSAFSIPTFNILSVIALSLWSGDSSGKDRIKKVIRGILTNPLIIGVFLGMIFLFLRPLVPDFTIKNNLPFIYKTVDSLAKITTPLALIVLGGRFDFKTTAGNLKQIVIGVIARIIVAPGIVITAAVLLSKYTDLVNFTADEYPAMVALFGTPVAVASAVMADQMENDGKLAAQLVVWTSLFSIVTIYFFIVILRSMGLL